MPPQGDANQPRILVIDDSVVVRQVLAMTVRQVPELLYATIDLAEDGAIALEKLKSNRYSLILADIRMPRVDGLELLRHVRQEMRDTETPIIIISTLGTDEDIQRAMDAGATGYVPKPLSPDRIARMISKILGSKK